MEYRNLLIETRDGVATVTVNRPDKLNALDDRTVEELDAEVVLEHPDLVTHRGRGDVEFYCRFFDAEMTRGGFKRAERIEWWQGVGHRVAVCHR